MEAFCVFSSWAGATVTEALSAARITTMGALLQVTGRDLEIEEEHGAPAEPPENLPDGKRMATAERTQQRMDFSLSCFLFPSLIIAPGPDQQHEVAQEKRKNQTQSPWRAKLALREEIWPEWRSFYKPLLSKKVADLQWRPLCRILAVNNYISILNSSVPKPACSETILHGFQNFLIWYLCPPR